MSRELTARDLRAYIFAVNNGDCDADDGPGDEQIRLTERPVAESFLELAAIDDPIWDDLREALPSKDSVSDPVRPIEVKLNYTVDELLHDAVVGEWLVSAESTAKTAVYNHTVRRLGLSFD